MKKILISLSIIGAVAAIVVGATTAYFSDTETSKGNTLTAGTINLTVDGEDPLVKALVELKDMKPSNWFAVQTPVVVTDNPADLYKHYTIGEKEGCVDNVQTEPECEELRGSWNAQAKTCTYDENNPSKDDLQNYTTIDLAICWDMNGDGEILKKDENPKDGTPDVPPSECEIIIKSSQHEKLGNVLSQWIPLIKNAEPRREYIVHQSFHLQGEEVTNWAQGDKCTFTEEFLANQVGAPVPGQGI